MIVTYTWKVTNIKKADVNDLSDVILHVRWEKTGTDEDGNTGSFQGATPLSAPHAAEFVPFAELTEATVLGWIQAIVVDHYEQHVNSQIQKQIDAKKNPVTEISGSDLPWATT